MGGSVDIERPYKWTVAELYAESVESGENMEVTAADKLWKGIKLRFK